MRALQMAHWPKGLDALARNAATVPFRSSRRQQAQELQAPAPHRFAVMLSPKKKLLRGRQPYRGEVCAQNRFVVVEKRHPGTARVSALLSARASWRERRFSFSWPGDKRLLGARRKSCRFASRRRALACSRRERGLSLSLRHFFFSSLQAQGPRTGSVRLAECV